MNTIKDKKNITLENEEKSEKPATFEEAVVATKFGKFNIILALLTMLASLCTLFDTTTMSYAFVTAQCDLDLSLSDKGLLNSVTYLGMISSALVWGFLFDVLGRKKLLTIGFLADSIFVFMSAFSQNLTLLLVSKYFQGFIINGPFSALTSYMSEFHCTKYRPTFQLLIGSCISIASVVLPLIAWIILPQNLDFEFFDVQFHSWNVFLLITGLPAFISGLTFLLFPESPKYLMTCGKNDKALAIFKKVYRINTGLPEDTYPIKELVDERKLQTIKTNIKEGSQRKELQALRRGLRQVKPLFLFPYLPKICLTCSIVFFNLMSLNMIRLWLPQIFQVLIDYEQSHTTSAELCTMLTTISSKNQTGEECFVNNNNSFVYINSAIVGTTALCVCTTVGFLIRVVGKKKILLSAEIMTCICCITMYFAKSTLMVIICSSLFIACGTVSSNIMTSITVEMFPTTLRTLAISMGLMNGRIGAMFGNLIFPFLLESGCEAPFLGVAGFLMVTFLLSLFVPKTDNQDLM